MNSVSIFNILFIVFLTIWNFICMISFFSCSNGFKTENEIYLSEVFQKTMFAVLSAFLTLSSTTNWWIFASRKQFCRIMNMLLEIDDELSSLGLLMNLRRQKFMVFCLTAFTFVLSTFGVVISNFIHNIIQTYENGAFVLISFSVCVELWLLINTHLFCFMWLIKLRFKTINSFLKYEFLTQNKKYTENENLKLVKAAELHGKLVEVSECFNKFYGVPVSSFSNVEIFSKILLYVF